MQTLWYNRHHWDQFCGYARQIKPRCVFLAGEQDPVAGVSNTKDMAELLPNAEVTPLSGVGHAAPVENPESVSAVIRKSLAALSLG
jgi:pimeloyl-ACP methyl ester carboxylesterase